MSSMSTNTPDEENRMSTDTPDEENSTSQEIVERIMNREKRPVNKKGEGFLRLRASISEKEDAKEDVKEDVKEVVSEDVADEIGKVFERLENKENRAIYTKSAHTYQSDIDIRKRREPKKRNINLMKSFVKAPFQYQESFLSLRTNIKFLTENKDYKKIIVTSAIPDEGKSSIAINLALALSSANNNVILVDADLRKPSIHQYLGLKDGMTMGLTNILYDKENIKKDSIRRNVDNKGLAVIPCGAIPPNPTEILGSQRMGQLLDVLSNRYDYVLIDTPPVSVVTDAAVLSRYTDGVLLVVKQKFATFEQANQAKKNLDAVNANILGVVINDFNYKHLDRSNAYYYYYSNRSWT